MTTSSRIRECIEYLNLAYYDLSKYSKNDKYHWVIKGQISDKEFELDTLLDAVDLHEKAYDREEHYLLRALTAPQDPKPPAG